MDLNASLVDQRVRHVVEQYHDALSRGDAKIGNDPGNMASRAFVALCVVLQFGQPTAERVSQE